MYIVHVLVYTCRSFLYSVYNVHVYTYIPVYPLCLHAHVYIQCIIYTHTVHYSPGARSAASIILRGANDFMVDEMERSVHDALCVVKRVLESQQVVAGGGAVEAALSIFLESLATSIVSGITCQCFF